MSNKKAATKSL